MKTIAKTILTGLCFVILTTTSGCSSEDKESKTDHIWKHQTDALQSAKDVAEKLGNNLEQQQQKLDQEN